MRVLRHLMPAAELELEERTRDYPDFVERKLVAREDAAADLAAWASIVRWSAGERPDEALSIDSATLLRWDPGRAEIAQRRAFMPPPPSPWEIMELAADKALRHLDRLRAASPDDGALAARRAKVDAILAGLQRARHFRDGVDHSRRLRAWRAAVRRFGDSGSRPLEAVGQWLATGVAQGHSMETLWGDLARPAGNLAVAVAEASRSAPADASLAKMAEEVGAVADMLERNAATFERRAAA